MLLRPAKAEISLLRHDTLYVKYRSIRIIHFKWLQWWFEWFKGAYGLRRCHLSPLFGFYKPPLSHHLSLLASISVLASSCSTLPVTISLSTHCFQLLVSYLLVYKKSKTKTFNVWYIYRYTCTSISVRYCLLRTLLESIKLKVDISYNKIITLDLVKVQFQTIYTWLR